jgi:hypothetical protein
VIRICWLGEMWYDVQAQNCVERSLQVGKTWLNFEGHWLRQGEGSLAFEWRKETLHVEGEVSNGVVVSNGVDRTEVYALLSRV